MDLSVRDPSGRAAGTVPFDPALLGGRVRRALLRQILIGYEANRRRGTHKTKTRSEVNYSYNKPWAQKHTGMARASGRASPLWRHGGQIFGPVPRSYRQRLPKRMRRGALRTAVLSQVLAGRVHLLTEFGAGMSKAKEAARLLRALSLDRGCLVVTQGLAAPLVRAFRNLPRCVVRPLQELNAWDVVRSPALLATRAGWEELVAWVRTDPKRRRGKAGAAA